MASIKNLALTEKVYDTAKIASMIDADSFYIRITVDVGFYVQTDVEPVFRIRNYDAPEKDSKSAGERAHHAQALQLAVHLLYNIGIKQLKSYKKQSFRRFTCDITLNDGSDFAQTMIAAGMQKKASY